MFANFQILIEHTFNYRCNMISRILQVRYMYYLWDILNCWQNILKFYMDTDLSDIMTVSSPRMPKLEQASPTGIYFFLQDCFVNYLNKSLWESGLVYLSIVSINESLCSQHRLIWVKMFCHRSIFCLTMDHSVFRSNRLLETMDFMLLREITSSLLHGIRV